MRAGFMLSGACTVSIGYFGCHRVATVLMVVFSTAFIGISSAAILGVNQLDLSPKYAGAPPLNVTSPVENRITRGVQKVRLQIQEDVINFLATVCKSVRPMLSDRCPVLFCPVPFCLSVTFVHCGQTVGRIKMKLGTQLGLGPGHIVLDGRPSCPKGAQPPTFGPYLLRPNSCVDQDATWYGDRPRPRRLGVTMTPLPKRGRSPQIYGPSLLWPNGWMDQDGRVLVTDVGLSLGDFVLDGDPPPTPQKRGGRSSLPNFQPMSIVDKRLDGSRRHLARRWAVVQATLC